MSHLARGPDRRSGIDSKTNAASGRCGAVAEPSWLEEAAV